MCGTRVELYRDGEFIHEEIFLCLPERMAVYYFCNRYSETERDPKHVYEVKTSLYDTDKTPEHFRACIKNGLVYPINFRLDYDNVSR